MFSSLNQLFSKKMPTAIEVGIINSFISDDVIEVTIGTGNFYSKKAISDSLALGEQVLIARTEYGRFIVNKTSKNKTKETSVIVVSG